MGSAMSADTRIDEELLDAARTGDETALAILVERHRDRLERMVRLRMDRRLQGRVDPADVVQDAYLAIRGKSPQYSYSADSHMPFFLWLRLEVGQKLVDLHRFHLGTQMRDAGQEVSLHRGALPQVTSLSLAEHLLGKLTSASHATMRVELKLRQQLSLGRHVALKVLPGHALLNRRHLQRFQREAKSAARLHHTNIVPV
jgi:RNA polymerase sigma-70 factor, ECF subfamily